MKNKIPYLLVFCTLLLKFGYSQQVSVGPTFGLIYSNARGYYMYNDYNKWKVGYMAGVEGNVTFWNRLEIINSFVLQKKRPLDVFKFDYAQNPNLPSNFYSLTAIINYPVTRSVAPKIYDPEKWGRFYDFHYLYFSTVPSVIFGKKLQIQAGVGGFYGRLLNPKQVEVAFEDLIAFEKSDSLVIVNTNRYKVNNGGIRALARIKYTIQPKYQLFASFEYWHSLSQLADYRLGLGHKLRHVVYAGTIGVTWQLE